LTFRDVTIVQFPGDNQRSHNDAVNNYQHDETPVYLCLMNLTGELSLMEKPYIIKVVKLLETEKTY